MFCFREKEFLREVRDTSKYVMNKGYIRFLSKEFCFCFVRSTSIRARELQRRFQKETRKSLARDNQQKRLSCTEERVNH